MQAAPDGDRVGDTGSYVRVNGLDVYCEIRGSGFLLVLLHGAIGTIESWFGDFLPALAAARQVIATELQGHGHRADTGRPLSYSQMAADVAGVLEALGVGTADLVGYSLGGGVARVLAIRRPEMVRRLVHAGGTSYRCDGLYPEVLAEPEAGADDLIGSPWHQAYKRAAPDPGHWPVPVAKTRQLDLMVDGWTDAGTRALAMPVLLIIGDSDVVRPEHTLAMFRLLGGGVVGDTAGLPAPRLAILPGSSHVGSLDRTDWLQSMTLEFAGSP